MTGTALTHYRITVKLGEGGMSEVYRASDTKLGREVAIKVLPEVFVEVDKRPWAACSSPEKLSGEFAYVPEPDAK